MNWSGAWEEVSGEQVRAGLQRELEAEVGPEHPLWGLEPRVIGRSTSQDDVVVSLADGCFAIVHLVWHGHIDQFPRDFPSTVIYGDESALQVAMESEGL